MEEFSRLLDRAESHRLRSLPFDDLRRLARLYRGESARLSRLRDRRSDPEQIAHLNALCVRAHGLLYSAKHGTEDKRQWVQSLVSGLAVTGPYLMVAWGVMATGALVGFFLVRLDPAALYALMPAGLGYDAAQIDALFSSSAARDVFFERETTSAYQNTFFGSMLFAHNSRVGMLAFAVGVLGGIPTLLLQFYNGIMVGSISAIFLHGEHALLYAAWILPHGVPELTAITLCTAAGLVLGHAVASPGHRLRSEALREAGKPAVSLVVASLPLFFAAAWIESFVRESALGTPARMAVAAGGAIFLLLVTFFVRREKSIRRDGADWLDELLVTRAEKPISRQAAP